jgi:eukaryotic-like serine/threonine-protein kinase
MRWINRRYRLDEPVGAGGSGVVWRGHDARLRRPVAIKTPSPGPAAHRRLRPLRREALLAASLSHPNIVSVYDYGETRSGVPFLVLEFIDGKTLTKLLADNGPLTPGGAALVCVHVASALAAVHAHGLVHGDLKPDNVMICRRGAKILDLGTAQPSGGRQIRGGTPAYAAPEQAGGPAGPEADMFAFGLLLRECLTARRSRPDADPPHVEAANAGRWPWLPDTVPDHLLDLVVACLSPTSVGRPTAADATAVLRRTGFARVGCWQHAERKAARDAP